MQLTGKMIGTRSSRSGEKVLEEISWIADGFRLGRISPYTGRPTLFSDGPGNRLSIFLPAGHWKLLLTRHPWSGGVLVRNGSLYEIHNLYSTDDDSGIVAVPVNSAGIDAPVSLESTGPMTPAARGSQTWFLGAESHGALVHPETGSPVSRTCRLISGQQGTFLALRTDTGVSNYLAETGVWEPATVAVFERFAAQARLIIDVGANIGHHSIALSTIAGPNARILAFEPQMQMFNLLNANIVLNGKVNITPYRMALSDASGTTKMSPISYDDFTNFGALGVGAGDAGELVPMERLDRVLDVERMPEPVGFIKLDVQSFELFVLRGAVRTIEESRPVIYSEISPYWMARRGYSYREIYDFLSARGYRFLDDDMKPHNAPEWDGASKAEWNIVALPS